MLRSNRTTSILTLSRSNVPPCPTSNSPWIMHPKWKRLNQLTATVHWSSRERWKTKRRETRTRSLSTRVTRQTRKTKKSRRKLTPYTTNTRASGDAQGTQYYIGNIFKLHDMHRNGILESNNEISLFAFVLIFILMKILRFDSQCIMNLHIENGMRRMYLHAVFYACLFGFKPSVQNFTAPYVA